MMTDMCINYTRAESAKSCARSGWEVTTNSTCAGSADPQYTGFGGVENAAC